MQPITQQTVKRMWERIRKTINVYDKTPHCFRHTFVTFAWRAGMDEKTLQTIGGYADLQTMKGIYTHVEDEDIAKAKAAMKTMFLHSKYDTSCDKTPKMNIKYLKCDL